MSEENFEIVRAAAAAASRGDLDAWLEYWTDDLDYPLRYPDLALGPVMRRFRW
jgi:ketosteroid isomerase-like protein